MFTAGPISITGRLALLFTTVVMLTFGAVGTYLYQALGKQLERRDDAELITKVMMVRHLLSEASSLTAIESTPHPFLDAVLGHPDLILRLVDPSGRVLVQSAVPSRPLPLVDFTPAEKKPADSEVRDWQSAHGKGRILAAFGLVGDQHQTRVQIVVAREASDHAGLLYEYGRNLLLAVFTGAILAAMLGFIIIRLGMRPLRSIIGKANDISTQQLNTRLSLTDTPAELRALGTSFNAMLDRLEDGVQRLSRFAADLAHDLRTPINTLLMETQVALSRPRAGDDYQALLESNIEEYERLARMIENTLFLARADNAQLALHCDTLNTQTELERIREYFEGLAEEAGVTITVESHAAAVYADVILLQRAVSNLVLNAIQHTPRGGKINLSAKRDTHHTEIFVANTGPGIAAEHLPHLFDRFYRVDAARVDSSQAAGLGLAIVRAIMRLHGGDVSVHSALNDRTVFCLRFSSSA